MWNNNTIDDEIQRNSLEYGVAVNTDRAIPDAKSGLKPVARRILWDAYSTGRTSNRPHVKSARIVGSTMGRLHPHGDSSIYQAMIRLAQDWVMRYPLIDVHGNKGNILGDGPAASRYTEARLSKITEDGLLQGLKKKNVAFMPNYDETEEEPITLPAIFPNLLCNPNDGIGWAMGCSWAPHNLREVAEAIKQVINGEEPMLPGPDFPTGGLIINGDDIPKIMATGKGSVKIRGIYTVKEKKITFTEIPYGTKLEAIMDEISKVCEAEEITGITNISQEGTKLIIEVEKNTNPESVVAALFDKTRLQTFFSYNQVALVDGVPTELNLKQAIEVYINHNIDCICKEATFDLEKAESRFHIVEGLIKALEDIDNIITLIKQSKSAADAKIELINKYNFTETQAKAILDMKLSKIAKLEGVELNKEKEGLISVITDLKALLTSRDKQIEELTSRLDVIVKKYGDKRRTEITNIIIPKTPKEKKAVVKPEPEDCVVVITQNNLIKRVPLSSYKVASRGTKGKKNQDVPLKAAIRTDTEKSIIAFSTFGKAHKIAVDKIPSMTNAQKGVLVNSLIKLDDAEDIVVISHFEEGKYKPYALFITENGIVNKIATSECIPTRAGGLRVIKVKDGDKIKSVDFVNGDEDVIFFTRAGLGLRTSLKEFTPRGKGTVGVKGMTLNEGDVVAAMVVITDPSKTVATFASNGLGKRTSLSEYTSHGRGSKGGKSMAFKGDGYLVGALLVSDEDNVFLEGETSSITISVADISTIGRITAGTILFRNNLKSVAFL